MKIKHYHKDCTTKLKLYLCRFTKGEKNTWETSCSFFSLTNPYRIETHSYPDTEEGREERKQETQANNFLPPHFP